MDAVLVNDAAKRLAVTPHRIFGLAFEWNEEPHSREWIKEKFKEWEYSHIVHDTVQSFILDVMSGRVVREEVPK